MNVVAFLHTSHFLTDFVVSDVSPTTALALNTSLKKNVNITLLCCSCITYLSKVPK